MSSTATDHQAIAITIADHVMTITINRPDVLNAFNDVFSKEMISALKQAEKEYEAQISAIIMKYAK